MKLIFDVLAHERQASQTRARATIASIKHHEAQEASAMVRKLSDMFKDDICTMIVACKDDGAKLDEVCARRLIAHADASKGR